MIQVTSFLCVLLCLFPTGRASIRSSLVQLLSRARLSVTAWTAACRSPLPFTVSWSLFKLMSIESVMLSDHFILCHLLLFLPLLFLSIRIFSNELTLHTRWPKYWNFSISIGPSKEYSGLISFRKLTGLISLQYKGLSSVFSNTTVRKHQFFHSWPSL